MPAQAYLLPPLSAPGRARAEDPPGPRFTIDGDDGLEAHLAGICREVRARVSGVIPPRKLEAILLGGGYGRGEGGVLHTPAGDRPYNDLEFYVLVRGGVLLNERRHGAALQACAHALSAAAGVEVEFKVMSRARLRRSPVTMFAYDLVQRHRCIHGHGGFRAGWAQHRQAENIPLSEATRLLMNRCAGLLFARERLRRPAFSAGDADFVGRNLAKARLALGDVVLAATGRYHWSCLERSRRLGQLVAPRYWPWFAAVREAHGRGVEFKLHPRVTTAGAAELLAELESVSSLALGLWLWLEGRRLREPCARPADYAASRADKCPETPRWRNWLVNGLHFGPAALWVRGATRYPRERLLRALPLLLWESGALADPPVRRRLQQELQTSATDFPEYVQAFARLWVRFR